MTVRRLAVLALALAACAAAPDGDPAAPAAATLRRAPPLPSYRVAPGTTTVSGLSSGGYFAQQLAVAYSAAIAGVAVIAAGPYDCGGEHPFYECMYGASPAIDGAIARTRAWSGTEIDDVANMGRQRVLLLSGALDTTVATSVMERLRAYYLEGGFVPAAQLRYRVAAGVAHTFPTDRAVAGDNPCWLAAPPYISDCGLDGAGAILDFLDGPLAPRSDGPLGGRLLSFDQTEFIADAAGHGLAPSGRIYVPARCAAGAPCRLHVAFHGCTQNEATIGQRFVRDTGFNAWADSNDIIVLYPQTVADLVDRDPQPSGAGANVDACWDWVGYYGPDFDRRTGAQLAAVARMIARVSGG